MQVKQPTFNDVWRYTIKGQSFNRIFQNVALSKIQLSGKGIDLGSKDGASSYYSFINIASNELHFADLYTKGENILNIDLEKEFPISAGSYDFVLLFNTIEHLYDVGFCLSECNRILSEGGKLVGLVPFLHKVHYDPDDYFRYTDSALERLLKDSGFSTLDVQPIGCGPFTAAANQLQRTIKINFIRGLVNLSAFLIDKAFFSGKTKYYPISYMFYAEK